jgi:hypothetical protein
MEIEQNSTFRFCTTYIFSFIVALENYAQGILAIADKYEILTLKEICETYLASTINSKNVASMVFSLWNLF